MRRPASFAGGALLIACLTAVALLGATASAAKQAPKPKPAKVTVNDFYFGPSSVSIKQGGSVKWVWSSLNTYPHDVHLKSGPTALKKKATYSTNTTAVTEAQFQKAFPTAGTYKFICTIHPTEMKLTVTVKK
jgi:plastocyanin